MDDIIAFIVFVILIFIIFYLSIHLLYVRHFKSYRKEIDIYLNKRNLTFKQKRKPKRADWAEGPFEMPPKLKLSLGTVKIGGVIMSMHDDKYFIIETSEKKNVWLKIDSVLLRKPNLIFMNVPGSKIPRTIKEIGNQKTFNCPACNYPIVESDKTCPDCGLTLK